MDTYTISPEEWKDALRHTTVPEFMANKPCKLQESALYDIRMKIEESNEDADVWLVFDTNYCVDDYQLDETDWGTSRFLQAMPNGEFERSYGDLYPTVADDELWHIMHILYYDEYASEKELALYGFLDKANQAVVSGEVQRIARPSGVEYRNSLKIKPTHYPDPYLDYLGNGVD